MHCFGLTTFLAAWPQTNIITWKRGQVSTDVHRFGDIHEGVGTVPVGTIQEIARCPESTFKHTYDKLDLASNKYGALKRFKNTVF